MRKILKAAGCLIACAISTQSMAQEMAAGSYAIELLSQDGDALIVGTLDLTETGAGQFGYEIDWDDSQFTDQFLSMRPFKCLDGATKQWCRVPYPYENRRTLTGEDLTDLEYDLLFIWKKQGDYGIDMWNGVYYDLEMAEDGLTGAMNEMDMDILSAPPDDGVLRPIKEFDLEPADPDSHWLPRLVLRPK